VVSTPAKILRRGRELMLGCAFATACGGGDRPLDAVSGGGAEATGGAPSGSSGAEATGVEATGVATSGFLFDVGAGTGEGSTGEADKCRKVDFLFVIDNSSSMSDEQAALIASFPGFIAAIQETVEVEDFHIMVVDTDGPPTVQAGGVTLCQAEGCCDAWCAIHPGGFCNNAECAPGDPCDGLLASGHRKDALGSDCGLATDDRYMIEGQPDLEGTFACIASVGFLGNGDELPIQATVGAMTTQAAPGQCNASFVRDDAILVVTVITDEEDYGKSIGDPASWHDAILGVKNGDEKAVVMLALVGDPDLPNATCQADAQGYVGAEASPRLRELAESFPFGRWGSICAANYAPFFEQAVGVIDDACEEFVPQG